MYCFCLTLEKHLFWWSLSLAMLQSTESGSGCLQSYLNYSHGGGPCCLLVMWWLVLVWYEEVLCLHLAVIEEFANANGNTLVLMISGLQVLSLVKSTSRRRASAAGELYSVNSSLATFCSSLGSDLMPDTAVWLDYAFKVDLKVLFYEWSAIETVRLKFQFSDLSFDSFFETFHLVLDFREMGQYSILSLPGTNQLLSMLYSISYRHLL